MRPTSSALRLAAALPLLGFPTLGLGQSPAPLPSASSLPSTAPTPVARPVTPAPAARIASRPATPSTARPAQPRPVSGMNQAMASPVVRTSAESVKPSASTAPAPAAYWGPAPPAAPKKKPTAVGRFFNRVGSFLGTDEEMGTTKTYRDPTTGRTSTGATKPWMKQMPNGSN